MFVSQTNDLGVGERAPAAAMDMAGRRSAGRAAGHRHKRLGCDHVMMRSGSTVTAAAARPAGSVGRALVATSDSAGSGTAAVNTECATECATECVDEPAFASVDGSPHPGSRNAPPDTLFACHMDR